MSELTVRDKQSADKARDRMKQKNKQLQIDIEKMGAASLLEFGKLVRDRARKILRQKGHVDTEALLWSIEEKADPKNPLVVQVGSNLDYAPVIENLPDGGYLFPATEQSVQDFAKVVDKKAVDPALERWGQ